MNSDPPYPGLAKSKRVPLIERTIRHYVRCSDYRWRELFEKADVVSEGAVRSDNDGLTYYGTTHIRLLCVLREGDATTSELVELSRLMRIDPHVRLRAIRVACLEARVRSSSELSAVRTEISFTDDPEAVCISVDVAAKITEDAIVGHKITSRRGR